MFDPSGQPNKSRAGIRRHPDGEDRCIGAANRLTPRDAIALALPLPDFLPPRVIQPPDLPAHGLWLFRASRLEALLDPLLALLDACPPAAALAPQRVVVADPAMRQWLLDEWCRRIGPGGIVANVAAVAPSEWIESLLGEVLGERGDGTRAWQREHLRWRIHAALGEISDPRLRQRLDGEGGARRRFALAERLARIFVQYLVYRPDWLAAWADHRAPRELAAGEDALLAPIWRTLRRAIATPHRGERLRQASERLRAAGPGDDTPLHLFGLSHLPPTEIALLQTLARRRLVVLYVPDPCRESWVGMASRCTELRRLATGGDDQREIEAAFVQASHPLLGSLGRIGQHFLLQLEDGEIAIDERHWQDRAEAETVPRNRLEWLQEGIRRADPRLDPPATASRRDDRSLRVHACHTRLRELEVLRDALLDAMQQSADLRHEQIVVMAPDIAAYAPLLPAVFGPPGDRNALLPWHLASAEGDGMPPLLTAFTRLLAVPGSRLSAPQVADLLALAPIRARLELSDSDADGIVELLRRSRVAWGLDASFRARQGVPGIAAQTLAWGMDRALAGHLVGELDETQVLALPDATMIAPLAASPILIGALEVLLGELAQWDAAAHLERPASAWASWLDARCAALLGGSDDGDVAAQRAGQAMRQAIARLRDEPAACGLDPALPFAAVRDHLLAELAASSGRARNRAGSVAFCGMVARRGIPHRVIAVLGLDDGALPRALDDGGLDPMREHPRTGDRDTRHDDRWLFLQTLMAAREMLHLSYVGESARDGKPRNPAAPLADLIALLDPDPTPLPDAASTANREQARQRRPWFVRHPLQPFDARYFDGTDPALFSFDPACAALDPIPRTPCARAPTPPNASAGPTPPVVQLREVLAWLKDPAKRFFQQHIGLRLDALDDDALCEDEALDADASPLDRIGRRIFMQAIADPEHALPDAAPAWLRTRALIAPGEPGEQLWAEQVQDVRPALDRYANHPLFRDGMPACEPMAIDVVVAGHRVCGQTSRVMRGSDGRWVMDVFPGKTEADLDFGKRAGLFLEWALARLAGPDDTASLRLLAVCKADKKGGERWQQAINAWDERFCTQPIERAARRADLHARIGGLLDLHAASLAAPLSYFPRTSAVAATREAGIEAAWLSGYRHTGERDYAPGYTALLAGDECFADDSDARRHLIEIARQIAHTIDLGDAPAEAAA